MKILQINAVYDISSTGKTTTLLQNHINNNTENICKSAFSYGGSQADGYIIGTSFDRKIHGFLSRFFGKQAWFSKGATKKLLEYVDEYKPDVVHLRNLHGNYINFPMLMKYISENNISTIITLHDCWSFTGKCCHYTVDKCYKWKTGCGNCPRLSKDNKSWFVDRTSSMWKEKKRLYNNVPNLAVIGVSDWITNEGRKSPLFENVKIFKRIYNGIDKSVFFPRETDLRQRFNLSDKRIVLAVASGWSESKGLSEIFRLSDMFDESYRVVMIGAYDGITPDKVIHIPATANQKELAEWYSTADVFITMSREETFGKVSAEALMCGTPIVCYNSTANPELVGENCGYVCKSGEIEEFKELIEKVVNNGKEAYCKSCTEFANGNFSFEKCFEEHLKLYEELQMMSEK